MAHWFKNTFVLAAILTAILLLPLVWFFVMYRSNTAEMCTRLAKFPIYLWCVYGGLTLACIGVRDHAKRIVVTVFSSTVVSLTYFIWLYLLCC